MTRRVVTKLNEIAERLRDIADRIEAEDKCVAVALVLGDNEGVKEAIYFGFMEPRVEIAKYMFSKGIAQFDKPKDELR